MLMVVIVSFAGGFANQQFIRGVELSCYRGTWNGRSLASRNFRRPYFIGRQAAVAKNLPLIFIICRRDNVPQDLHFPFHQSNHFRPVGDRSRRRNVMRYWFPGDPDDFKNLLALGFKFRNGISSEVSLVGERFRLPS
jgi:hypothetical protein